MFGRQTYRALIDTLAGGVAVIDSQDVVHLWSQGMARMFGIDANVAVGRPLDELVNGLESPRFVGALRRARELGLSSFLSAAFHQQPLRPLGGAAPRHSVRVSPVGRNGPSPGVMLQVIEDHDRGLHDRYFEIRSELEAKSKELQVRSIEVLRRAAFDPLTGLANRMRLREHLHKALDETPRSLGGAVIQLDLDQFNLINDSLGAEEADVVLRQVADRLAHSVRQGDLVARVGGDEFVVVLDRVDTRDDALFAGRRLVEAIAEPFLVRGREVYCTASAGFACYPGDATESEALLSAAGTALHRAKQMGGSQCLAYASSMSEGTSDRISLIGALRKAVEKRDFKLFYQPQINLKTGQVLGVEALLRWQHPQRGMVSPAEFVPVLEETGLILEVGQWVLQTACAQSQEWQAQGGPPLRVAVNVSARQFADPEFVERARSVLNGTRATNIEVEITESLLMSDVQASRLILSQLKEMGVRVAVDDFGTGYSSLVYLKRFPIDTLKIDRAFVRELTSDSEDAAIVGAIIALGHNLGMEVLAEGVETAGQLAHLKGQGCDVVQGFFFGRPMPVETFWDWWKSWTPGARV